MKLPNNGDVPIWLTLYGHYARAFLVLREAFAKGRVTFHAIVKGYWHCARTKLKFEKKQPREINGDKVMFKFRHFIAITSLILMVLVPIACSLYAQPRIGMGGGAGGGDGFSMNGAMGATIINGKSYQYFSLRPDIPIWKFGLGLDLSFYFDEDGKLREEDWDETADIIDKIYYIRYGKPGEPLFVRAGSLDQITLGYGLVMRRYTNAIEWPQERRIGLQTEINFGDIKTVALLNNFRELDSPGLVGGRISYRADVVLPMIFGATVVHDGNQFLGAKDEDGDGIPDYQDMFPGEKDATQIAKIMALPGYNEIYTRSLIELGQLPDIYNPPLSIDEQSEPVTEFCLDVGVPLINTSLMNVIVYAQAAQIANNGRGYTVPGIVWWVKAMEMLSFQVGAEYRIFGEDFAGDFFNYSYEIERVKWDPNLNSYVTKEQSLKGIPSAQGFYADLEVDLFKRMFVLFGAYSQMTYEDAERPSKAFYASAGLNTTFIPKIDLVEGYFQQPTAEKLFSTDQDGTVIGYRVGATMGGGVMLVYDNKTIYYNGEPNKIMTIETVIKF